MPRGGKREGAGRKAVKTGQDKPKIGAPSSYKAEYAEQARKLCELGATDKEISDFFEISGATLYRWQGTYPAFREALKVGKEAADDRVERSLYHRANGYTYDAVKILTVKGEVQKVPYREHVPPDTTACIFWLKNRRKDAWRDVQKHEIGGVGAFDDLSDDQLLDMISQEAASLHPKDVN
jgi:hypothetical protein